MEMLIYPLRTQQIRHYLRHTKEPNTALFFNLTLVYLSLIFQFFHHTVPSLQLEVQVYVHNTKMSHNIYIISI